MEKDIQVDHVEETKNNGVETVVEQKDGNVLNLTPEMHDLINNAISTSFGQQVNDSGQFEPEIEYIIEKMMTLSDEQALEILKKIIVEHDKDFNFPAHTLAVIKNLVQGPKANDMNLDTYTWTVKTNAALIHFNSPYAEVRAIAEPFDDPSTPQMTIRAYLLGIIWMCGCTAVNTFFAPRQPSININTSIIQLLIYPSGIVLEKVVPDWGITIWGKRHSLNPGRWTYKEQMLATIIVNIANGPVGYVMPTFLVLKMPYFFGYTWITFGFEILIALSTQLLGLGYAGILRRVVIYPIKAIWPGVLPTIALNRALIMDQKKESINGWIMSRYKFFFVSFTFMFFYFWIPNYLFTALHAFNWTTWIAPRNFNLANITGFYAGMGFNPWGTFDWNVAFTGRLVTPAYSTIQQYVGSVLSGLIIIATFYTNFDYTGYLPINSNDMFTNTGAEYDITQVLTNGRLDKAKYEAYSFPYSGAANLWGQGSWFAWYPMCLIYIGITQWPMIQTAYHTLVDSIKRTNKEPGLGYDDPHSRMMSAYKEVPDWWYFGILVVSLVFGVVAFVKYPIGVPVWILFVTVVLSLFFLIPMVILNSMANVTFQMNQIFSLLAGWWFPGNPTAMLMMMNYGYNMDYQAEAYITNQKMAHYAKVSPRGIFFGQVAAVILNSFVFVGMTNWMTENFKDMCSWSQPDHFVCTSAHQVYGLCAFYGVASDRRIFDTYPIIPYCFLIGGFVGLVFAIGQKYGPQIKQRVISRGSRGKFLLPIFNVLEMFKYFNLAAFFNGCTNTWTGGYNLIYKTGGFYLSIIMMVYVKNRYTKWWQKYNYILECGFDIGVAVSGIIQTFALQWNNYTLNWWGNTVSTAGLDYEMYSQQTGGVFPIPAKGYFGPAPGTYP